MGPRRTTSNVSFLRYLQAIVRTKVHVFRIYFSSQTVMFTFFCVFSAGALFLMAQRRANPPPPFMNQVRSGLPKWVDLGTGKRIFLGFFCFFCVVCFEGSHCSDPPVIIFCYLRSRPEGCCSPGATVNVCSLRAPLAHCGLLAGIPHVAFLLCNLCMCVCKCTCMHVCACIFVLCVYLCVVLCVRA